MAIFVDKLEPNPKWSQRSCDNELVTVLSNGEEAISMMAVWQFVCIEVLWPSQPNGVISSMVSLPNHTFTGQA